MLEISAVSAFYGKHLALDNVSLNVGRGEIVVILGANGAGKTTLLKVIGGLVPASTGARIADCTSGFRAVNRRVLASFARYYPTDYPEPESLALLLHSGLTVLELPVIMRPRQGGVSSIKALDGAIYMVKVLSVISAYGTFHGTVARET